MPSIQWGGNMLGVIGGTGFYAMEGLDSLESHAVQTPFGEPSGPVVTGTFEGSPVAFLARHGEQHQFLPGEINFRANIWALKSMGVRRLLAVSAVGSLKKEIVPGHLAIAGQYLDFTKGKRSPSFFGNGLVAHISTAEPACASLAGAVYKCCIEKKIAVHTDVTYACVEGPRLGTRAESFFLRNSGGDIVGMTNVPEAFLAREAQLCYCTLAVSTDYDCWLEDPNEHATVDRIIAMYKESLKRVVEVIKVIVPRPLDTSHCRCRNALEGAVLSDEGALSPENREILSFLRS